MRQRTPPEPYRALADATNKPVAQIHNILATLHRPFLPTRAPAYTPERLKLTTASPPNGRPLRGGRGAPDTANNVSSR